VLDKSASVNVQKTVILLLYLDKSAWDTLAKYSNDEVIVLTSVDVQKTEVKVSKKCP
jgi:hypothetical protein